MAYRLNLSTPYEGMSFIWNISAQVGDSTSCQNNPTDVHLVTMLLGAWITSVHPSIHPSCRQAFEGDGRMTINKAYWIRAANSQHTQDLSFSEAGIISPARPRGIYGQHAWSIVRFNYTMRSQMRTDWENLPNHRQCTPALRAELLNNTQ